MNAEERSSIAGLGIERASASNSWIGIEDEFASAERSDIDERTQTCIDHDLSGEALEGMTEERWAKIRKRAAWLADKFVRQRSSNGSLRCDDCGFDPAGRPKLEGVQPRSLFDVHHKYPLEEGRRYTTVADFALLCPTCHRIAHALIRLRRTVPA